MRSYLVSGYSIGQLLSRTVKSGSARIVHGPIEGPALLAAVREASAPRPLYLRAPDAKLPGGLAL